MKSQSNLSYITLTQIIGCILVILGHSYPFVTPIPDWGGGIKGFLYAFHMPLFVWCSGYLFAHTNQTGRKGFLVYFNQRSIKLLVPYFAFSLIGIVPKILAAPVLNDTLEFDALQLIRAFFVPREGVWGHFWFLPMVYFVGLLGFTLDKLIKQNLKVWILITLLSFSLLNIKSNTFEWLAINDVLHFFPYFGLGVLCCRYNCGVLKSTSLYACIFVGFGLSLSLFSYIEETGAIGIVRNAIIAICMIITVLYICVLIDKHVHIERNALIAQTYQIFILSWPCQLVAGIILERLLHVHWLVFLGLVFCVGISLPLIILHIIDIIENKYNTKILSFICGR